MKHAVQSDRNNLFFYTFPRKLTKHAFNLMSKHTVNFYKQCYKNDVINRNKNNVNDETRICTLHSFHSLWIRSMVLDII